MKEYLSYQYVKLPRVVYDIPYNVVEKRIEPLRGRDIKKKHEIARPSMSSICASFSGLRFSDFRRSFSILETFALAADIQATLFL